MLDDSMSVWRPYLLKVFLSNQYTYAAVLHKATPKDGGQFVASASTIQKDVRTALQQSQQSTSDVPASRLVGKLLAEQAKSLNLESVKFERGPRTEGTRFHGRLRALIESIREHGIRVE